MRAILALIVLAACRASNAQTLDEVGPPAFVLFGIACCEVGDVDGDGVPDLALGDANDQNPPNAGAIESRSGATCELIWRNSYLAMLDGRAETPVRRR